MILENGLPISLPVIKPCSNRRMKSSWASSVTLRFSAAFTGVTLRHSAGGRLRCRLRESRRTKKSPQWSQKWISSGRVSVVLQCSLNSSKSSSFVSGQRQHLIAWTAPSAKSASGAWRSNLYLGLNLRGISKKLCHFLMLLLHRAVNMVTVHLFLINTGTPPDPNRLPIRGVHRPTQLETWSQQGSVVNTLRTRGREPLRSASRLLGCTAEPSLADPGCWLVAGPSRGLRCLQDPL
jgi:hypothetical protein